MAIITKKTALLWIALIAGALALVKFFWKPMQSENITANQSSEQQQSAKNTVRSATVKTRYNNPSGSDEIGFTLGIDDKGTITEAKTDVLAANPTSKMRQEAFAAALPSVLVGKDISTLKEVDRVGGSSLSTAAFNSSISALKAQL